MMVRLYMVVHVTAHIPLLLYCTDLMVALQTVNTSASEGSSLVFEVILQGQLADNLTITYHLDFADGTANCK